MTTMSGPGFGMGGGGGGGYGGGQYPGESSGYVDQRTSVMAILSLVFALICFIPGFALLGALFGVASLVAISRSGDRLTGRGLAIAGLILSLIVLGVYGGLTFGAFEVWKAERANQLHPAGAMMAALEAGDHAGVRASLTNESAKVVTDADIDAFVDGYHAELGKFVGLPSTFWSFWNGFVVLEPQLQSVSAHNDAVPLPGRFEKGSALLVFQVAPTSAPTVVQPVAPATNLVIMTTGGSKLTLYDPQRGPGAGGATPPKAGEKNTPPVEKPDSSGAQEKPAPPAETPKEPEKPGPG